MTITKVATMIQGRKRSAAAVRGFTLVELSMVLAVIGLIVSAVMVGRDVHQSATYTAISSQFVQGWRAAYDRYVHRQGRVPADGGGSGWVNGGGGALCNDATDALLNEFLGAGVTLPRGAGEGRNHRYTYTDTNGLPQSIEVCFRQVNWAVPDGSVGNYAARARNVMELRNLTASLARHIDAVVDGRQDARFGRFREVGVHDSVGANSVDWSANDRMSAGSLVESDTDEDQVAVVNAFYLMSR